MGRVNRARGLWTVIVAVIEPLPTWIDVEYVNCAGLNLPLLTHVMCLTIQSVYICMECACCKAGTVAKKLLLDVVEVRATVLEFVSEHGKQKLVAVTVQQD